jgi:ABC-type polysaccharide/polyol phosphate export permease
MAQLHAAVASRERVWALAAGRYRATHARTVLGGVWWFLDPLLHLAALSIVMAALELPPVTVPGPDGSPRPVPYVLFLATAMVPWKWFTASLTRGAFAVIESRPLFVQVRLAAIEPVLAALLQEAWHLLIGLGVFALIAAAFGYMPGPSLAALPALLLVQATFQTALALLLSVGCFFFRDLANVLPLGLTLLMYLSPVIYSLDRVSPAFRPFFEANPMAVLIGAYRDVLLAGAWPQPAPLAAVAAGSFVLLLIAARRFDRAEGDFSKSA